MRRLCFALFILLLSGPVPQVWAEPTASDRAAIRQVVEQQLQAFQRDDGAAAFGFASPNIQSMFGSAERFMDMVRGAYKPVYRPREVAFRDLQVIENEPVQPVVLVGPDGVPVLALYKMEWQDKEQVWRINGCILVPSEDRGA
jgi:hypothetical protein